MLRVHGRALAAGLYAAVPQAKRVATETIEGASKKLTITVQNTNYQHM
jgi:hypothetical protein